MNDPQITVEHTSPVVAKVKFQIPAPRVTKEFDNYFEQVAKVAKIPGFRPGKVPVEVVRQRYAKESVSELGERLIMDNLFTAIKEHSLDVILPPMLLSNSQPEEHKDFIFEVQLDLKPKMNNISIDNLKIDDFVTEPVKTEEIDEEIRVMREGLATVRAIDADRGAQLNDFVVIKFEGSVDGKVLPNLTAESHEATLGKGELLDDFEKNVIGLKKGESKEFDFSFPQEHREDEMKGKTARFKIELLAIKEKILPELDDEFAVQADDSVKTFAELKSKIEAKILSTRERGRRDDLRYKIGTAIVEKNPIEVSKRQVELVAKRLADQTHRMMHEMGVPHQDNEEHDKKLWESSLKKAERDVKLSYLLEAVAEQNKLSVESGDVDKRLKETAEKTGISLAQIKSYYSQKDENESESRLERLKMDILDEKSLDYVLSRATIKSKDS